MGFRWASCAALFAVLAVFLASPLQAKAVGTAVAVTRGVQLISASGTSRLTIGMRVETGDIIKTNRNGQAQLLFGDDTKIVVGPRSHLVLDDILLRSNGRAKQFTINALGGTFRFISGKSKKRSYKINTPTATMGIRGTIFDFSVARGGRTNVVLFEGEVELCLRNGSCKRASGACTLSRARVNKLKVGITGGASKNDVLRSDFPYVVSQKRLLESFYAPTKTCGNIEKPTQNKTIVVPSTPPPSPTPTPPPSPTPTPPTPTPPPPGPAPPPPTPEPGTDDPLPGQSGNETEGPSTGKGNDVSNQQHGQGQGKGQGISNRSMLRGSAKK